MPDFNHFESLIKYVEKNLQQNLKDLAQEIEKIMRDYIQKNLASHEYLRSYDYINSLTVGKVVNSGNEYTVKIYFDTSKIQQTEISDNRWNQHMNIDGSKDWNGIAVNELIPIFLENGVKGSLFDRKGIKVCENVKKEILDTQFHLKKIRDLLKNRGINVIFE